MQLKELKITVIYTTIDLNDSLFADYLYIIGDKNSLIEIYFTYDVI